MNRIPNFFSKKYSLNRYARAKKRFIDNPSFNLPPERFVIFNFPRSGSNLLCSMLNQHPEILCHHELFNPQRIYYSKDFHTLLGRDSEIDRDALTSGKVGLASKIGRDLNPEAFFFRVWKHHYESKAVGFNLFPSHAPNASASIMADPDVKKILLLRRNKLRCYVSRSIARQTGVWDLYTRANQQKGKAITPPESVKINPQHLVRWARSYDRYFERARKALTKSGQPFLEITYEDIVGPHGDQIKSDLLSFINVSIDLEYLTPPLRKQNSSHISNLISNFAEVKDALLGTELEAFI